MHFKIGMERRYECETAKVFDVFMFFGVVLLAQLVVDDGKS